MDGWMDGNNGERVREGNNREKEKERIGKRLVDGKQEKKRNREREGGRERERDTSGRTVK